MVRVALPGKGASPPWTLPAPEPHLGAGGGPGTPAGSRSRVPRSRRRRRGRVCAPPPCREGKKCQV
eukprot:132702-Alexandrium_andersonii.AAC.1